MLSCLRGSSLSRSYIAANFLNCGPQKGTYRNFISKNTKKHGLSFIPKMNTQTTNQESTFYTIVKWSAFTIGFCGVVFTGAAIWNYEHIKRMKNSGFTLDSYKHKEGDFRKVMNKWWNALPEGGKIFWGICATNVFVFLCWRFHPFQSVMLKYFCSNSTSKGFCLPMLLSTFSHYSSLHLFINMYVLYGFSNILGQILGCEQFLAFYLAGGVVSNLGSNVLKLLMGITVPSLGASGSIMALLGYFCTKFPDVNLQIILIPYAFPSNYALKGLVLFDMTGIIFQWKLFDHAAHLSGTLFGVLYALYGQKLYLHYRPAIIKYWHNLRER